MKNKGFTLTKVLRRTEGFTLIELLVVICILGILLALSVFGMQGARQASRDATRKSDLEEIRSGLEMYKADCNIYPLTAQVTAETALEGDDSTTSCLLENVYISKVPTDPVPSTRSYLYTSDGTTYALCASLEQGGSTVTCGGSSNCGGSTCNYRVTNP